MTHQGPLPTLNKITPILLILAAAVLLGCGLTESITGMLPGNDDSPMSIEEALAVEPDDARPTVLEEMGPPDAFSITFDELEGQIVRWETWSYFDFNTQFDFIDGELLWTVELEEVEDGSIYAHWYDPLDFQAGMNRSQVEALLADQELLEIDLETLDLEGGLMLTGDQILLGFQDNRLFYVETMILSPDPQGEPLGMVAADGQVKLTDDFEGSQTQAIPVLDDSFMVFEHAGGKGSLTTKFTNGVMVANYEDLQLKDFILEVELEPLDLSEKAEAGVTFRSETADSNSTYFYNLTILPATQQLLLMGRKGQDWALQDLRDIPPDLIPEDGVYRLKIDCQGSTILVYLQDQLAAEFTTGLIQEPGFFGLAMLSQQPPETTLFDNLVITEHP